MRIARETLQVTNRAIMVLMMKVNVFPFINNRKKIDSVVSLSLIKRSIYSERSP